MAAFPNPFRAIGLGRKHTRNDAPPALAGVGSRYLQDSRSPLMWNWKPVLREAQADTQEAYRIAAAQVVDAMHTSGWLHGGLVSARGQMINPDGLTLNLKPWAGVISSDARTQAAWARDVEGRFAIYAANPHNVDYGGRYGLGQLCGQAVNQYFAFGEVVATTPYAEAPGMTHGTKLNIIPASRLSQANGPTPNTIQGVTLDPARGSPVGYNFIQFNLAAGTLDQRYVKARDERGTARVIHLLDNAASAVRGITPLAPALRIVRQFDQLQDATLTTALLQTIFAATVESEAPTEDLMRALQGIDEQEATDEESSFADRRDAALADQEGVPLGSFMSLMSARSSWYKNTNIDLGRFGKIAHLFPGEKLTFNRAQIQGTEYQAFAKTLIREIARCAGITTYALDGDFNGFTYTTAKMAVDEAWPLTLWRRAHIPARLCQSLFEAWLEEDIIRGFTILPGGIEQFYAQKHLICRADWRGPPRPTADDLKTAKAYQVLRAEGWASTERIAAEYDADWVEVADSQSETEEYRRDKGLDPLPSLGGGGNGAGSAAVAGGGRRDPDGQTEATIDRETRLVGALMRGDEAAVEALMDEYLNVE